MTLLDDIKTKTLANLQEYATGVAASGAKGQAEIMLPAIKQRAIIVFAKALAPYAVGAVAINVLAAIVWARSKRQT